MRRPITWAELILVLIILPTGIYGGHKAYEYLTDKINIQVEIKQ